MFETCESRGSRGERIDLGQPIAAAIPDGVPPGCAGFRVCKSTRRLSCVSRCRSGLLRRELRCITPGVEGTRYVFVCQQHLVGRKIKCPNGLTMYFVPESLATLPISPNLDLSFHNPLVRQMFLLHNALGEAYPPNCTVGYDTSVFRMDY